MTDGPVASVAPGPPVVVADAPSVRLDHVTAGYGRRIALSDVSLDVRAGSLLAVIGPNGAGKSTLLKLIAGLLEPVSGTISVLGAPPGGRPRDVAYVPQAEAVDWDFPVTVAEVAMMGRYARLGFGRRPVRRRSATCRGRARDRRDAPTPGSPDRRPVRRPAAACLPGQGDRRGARSSTCSTSR